ncbi:MAG: hypothetical protein HYR94_02490 [Chloroflexi bacterium]|nr:hypothetical protein [Chloroflexota bacterium]
MSGLVRIIIEPFRIKTVEPIRQATCEEREAELVTADYTYFGLEPI